MFIPAAVVMGAMPNPLSRKKNSPGVAACHGPRWATDELRHAASTHHSARPSSGLRGWRIHRGRDSDHCGNVSGEGKICINTCGPSRAADREGEMNSGHCQHKNRSTGVFPCDLARIGNAPLYSTAFKATICRVCGHTEFYCESHREVCAWLDGRWSKSSESPSAKVREVKPPKKTHS